MTQAIQRIEESTGLPMVKSANPMDIIASLVERGGDIHQLEKLMDMQERWERNEARKAYSAAMVAAQKEMPRVVKDKHNAHTNSDYASEENVVATCKPILIKHGLTCSIDEVESPADSVHILMRVRHVDGHEEQFHRYGPIDNVGAKGSATKTVLHGRQSTVSYLSRTLFCDVFGVVIVGKDTDGNIPQSYITEAQAIQLDEMIQSYGADRAKFLDFYGIKSTAELPASRFQQAFAALQKKGAKKGEAQ